MIKTVVFIGPESTLKTTLAKKTASFFSVPYLPEVARNYAKAVLKNKQRNIIASDVLKLARLEQLQFNKLKQTVKYDVPFIIQDTDNISTLVYVNYYFKNFNIQLLKPYINTTHKVYILTYPDVNFVPDGIRDIRANRLVLFNKFKATLDQKELPYTIVSGSLEKRLAQSIDFIKKNNF